METTIILFTSHLSISFIPQCLRKLWQTISTTIISTTTNS